MFVIALWMVLWGAFGGLVGRRHVCGEIWGGILAALLGPFGLLAVALCPMRKGWQCPFCKSFLPKGASVCAKCGREVPTAKGSGRRRPVATGTVPCPNCRRPLRWASIRVNSTNRCPHCGVEFDVD